MYLIKIESVDKDGVIDTQFLTKDNKTFTTGSLLDAITARDSANPWFKGDTLTVCVLSPLTSLNDEN
jgi:hypothetical protein